MARKQTKSCRSPWKVLFEGNPKLIDVAGLPRLSFEIWVEPLMIL